VGLAEIEVYEVPVGAPVASNACVTTPANTPVTGQLTATDPEGQPLTYSLVTQAGKGAVNLDISGNFAYTPNNPNLRGLDKFTYQVTDTSGLTSTGSVWVVIDGAIRIMPVGDSITAGYPGFFVTEDYWVSFRRKLFNDLSALYTSTPFGINFVGTVTNLGASAVPPLADRDNEGHSGWRDDEIANGTTDATRQQSCSTLYPLSACNIAGWLDVTQPDVVLLHIGTNGINSGGGTSSADVAAILDKIQTWETANSSPVTVMLARIIGSPDATTNANVTTFNNNVAAMAQTRINNGDKIVIVNQQTGASLTYQLGAADGSSSGPDMGDNLHPNQDGYEKMADKWKADLISSGTLPSCP
jgi:lysophospholipase L1-like esterase